MAFDPNNPMANGPVVYQTIVPLCFMICYRPDALEWLETCGYEHKVECAKARFDTQICSAQFTHKAGAALFKLMFT